MDENISVLKMEWTTMLRHAIAIAASSVFLLIGAASAAPITENLSFNLGNFLDGNGTTAPPITTLSGSITVTFDPTQSYNNDTADLTIHSLSFAAGSTVAFAYNPSLSVLSFGGEQTGVGDIGYGTNDFVIQFDLANLAAPRLSLCSDPGFSCGSLQGNSSYTSSGYTLAAYPNDFWLALAGTTTTSVPEPGTVALLALPLGLMGLLVTRRRWHYVSHSI